MEGNPIRINSKYKGLTATIILFALFVIGMVGAVASIGWTTAVQALSNLGTGKVVLLLGFATSHYFIRALRWHLLTRAVALPTTFRQNMRHFFGGFALTATPGRLGELVRLRWIGRETGWPPERSIPIVFADRALELVAVTLLIVLAVGMSNLGTSAIWPVVAISVMLAWISCRPKLLTHVVEMTWRGIGRGARFFVKLRRVTKGLGPFMTPKISGISIILGMIGWFLEGVAFYILLAWLGVEIFLWTATAIFLAAVLSGALSGLPGGLGGTEAASVALLLLQGVSLETALLATLVIRLTTLWYAVLLGLAVLPFSEAGSRHIAVR